MEQNIETRITEAAKEIFLKKGYKETNMNDIASAVGLTRPALHYYFRTKERLFQAVFGDILRAFLPKIKDIILSDSALEVKVTKITDTYLDVLMNMPELPLFLMKEAHRDLDNLLAMASENNLLELGYSVIEALNEMAERGEVRKIPFLEIVYTFYGLMTFPFLSMPIACRISGKDDIRSELTTRWRDNVISQMVHLLKPQAVS